MVDMKPLAMMMVLALAALALAACGSSGNDNSGKPSNDDKAFDNAVRLAGCMRQHGIQMSDPQRTSGGGIMMKSGGGPGSKTKAGAADPDSPKFRAAERACAKYAVDPDSSHQPSPQEQAERNDALIGYAQCMRRHGLDYPDPRIEGNRVSQRLGPGANPNSPKFKAADRACHAIMEKFGPGPGGGGDGPGTQVAK
jgi:hypothetical protein